METLESQMIFEKGEKNTAYAAYFKGQSYLNMLVTAPGYVPVGNVTFEPGCRNHWHIHPGGQILLCTAGSGWYQEEGQDPRSLLAGDIVIIPKGMKHWHGAKQDSWFTHIAIENDPQAGQTEWGEEVTDEIYDQLSNLERKEE